MCEPVTLTALAAGGGAAALSTTPIMAALLAGSVAAGAAGAYQQSSAAKKMANYNAQLAESQAADAIARGDADAAKVRRDSSRMQGAQRAAFSAKGIDTGVGTADEVIGQTDFFGQVDAQTAKTNAQREAWGYRAKKKGYEFEAKMQRPTQAAALSLLGSAGQVAPQWYAMKGK